MVRLSACLLLLGLSGAARAQDAEPKEGDNWRKVRVPAGQGGAVDAETASQLAALGYLEGFVTAPSLLGVTRATPGASWGDYTLYVSGHDGEAELMDMQGKVVHTWRYAMTAWPPNPQVSVRWAPKYWRQVEVFPDGSLLVLVHGAGLFKITRDSKLLWARLNAAHHLFQVEPDGRILTLTNRLQPYPQYAPAPLLVDAITLLDKDGNTLSEVNVLEALDRSPTWRHVWHDTKRYKDDVFHVNSVTRVGAALAARLPGVQADDVLVSCRDLSALLIVDLESKTVVWAGQGAFKKQHDAEPTADGQILLFDNYHDWGSQQSAIEIYDPSTMRATWSFAGTTAEPFFSQAAGVQRVLPNGNLLVSETWNGRILEINRAGAVVWEFYNPHRAGESDELIAAIYDAQRLSSASVRGWLGK